MDLSWVPDGVRVVQKVFASTFGELGLLSNGILFSRRWLDDDGPLTPLLFPADGIAQVGAAALAFGNAQRIKQAVVVFGSAPQLSCSFEDVPGVLDYVIRISRDAGPPVNDNNIAISPREIAKFDSARITVAVI